jgi:HEAT repeat protein
MRKLSLGSTRTLLLAALALAAAVVVGSFALVALRGDSSDESSDRPDGEGDDEAPLGRGTAGLGHHDPKKTRTKSGKDASEDGEGTDPGGEEWVPRGQPKDSRTPEGDVFVVTADTLRAEFAVRHWEEVRRMIDELQAKGEAVPADVVKQLVDMLAKDDLRLDAVLALGGVKDDAAGRALAELAGSHDADLATRQAALDALAKSGQKSVLPMLQALVASEGLDEGVARHAMLAIAGVGGPDATKTLLAQLEIHRGDDLQSVIVTALGKTHDSDAAMAETLRGAAEKADKDKMQAVLVAAQMQADAVGPELKAELQRIVESPASLSAFTDDVERQLVQGTAMPAAVAAGVIEPVLRAATTSGPLRDIALNALRQARGDAAAKQIATALAQASDDTQRRDLTAALGETGSFTATPTLVALLDDASANIRNAAARGLGQIRDPAAVKPILAHLAKAAPDHDFANALVVSLGTIGANEALPALEKLAANEEDFWRQLRPFVQNAIVRITTGNPESLRLK